MRCTEPTSPGAGEVAPRRRTRRGPIPGRSISTSVRLPIRARSSAASAAAPAARSRAARSRTTRAAQLRHARRRRAGPRAVRKDMQKGDAAFVDEVEAAAKHRLGLGRKAGDQIGADRDLRAQGAGAARDRDRLGAACRRFIRFRIRSSPACSDRCRCGISRGSSASSRHRSSSISAGSSEDRRSRGSSGTARAAAAPSGRGSAFPADRRRTRSDRRRSARSRDTPAATRRARLLDDRAERHRAARPARIGDDAERAAMVAALLHLQEGAARVPLDSRSTRCAARLRASHRAGRRVGDGRGGRSSRPQLRPVVEHHDRPRQRGVALGRERRGAAGDDDRAPRDARGGRGGSPGAPGARPRR